MVNFIGVKKANFPLKFSSLHWEPCAEKDIKRVNRLGRYKEGERERPVLVEFRDATIKNRMLESLSKLRGAEDKFKRILITHGMTRTEREQCRRLVEQCREKQNGETSGNRLYRVKRVPGDMRIVRLKRD